MKLIRKSVPNMLQVQPKIDQNRHRIATSKHIKNTSRNWSRKSQICAQKWTRFFGRFCFPKSTPNQPWSQLEARTNKRPRICFKFHWKIKKNISLHSKMQCFFRISDKPQVTKRLEILSLPSLPSEQISLTGLAACAKRLNNGKL